jgi:hypothetical protein
VIKIYLNNITLIWFLVIVPTMLTYTFLSVRREYKLQKTFNNVYDILSRIPLIQKEISDVRLRLYKINLWDESFLRYKAATKYLVSLIVFIILTLLSIAYFSNNLYVMFSLIFFSYQFKNFVLDWQIGNNTNLLKGLKDYVEDVMKEFAYSHNVILALKVARDENTHYTTVAHVEKSINAIDDQEKMDEYSQECHDEFLRLLSTTCFLTNEQGDTISSNGKTSNFVESLKDIYTLIEIELYKRRELKYWIKGLPFQCIIPLLIIIPYENWVNTIFTMVKEFYQTSSAFILKIGITIICLICFSIIKSYEKTEGDPILIQRINWETALFKFKPLAKFVKFIIPRSGISTKIENIYLRKLLLGFGTFILTLLITVSINKINYNNILKNNTTSFQSDLITASGKQIESTTIENEILNSLDSNDPEVNKDTATKLLMQKGVLDQSTLKKISQKIVDKKEVLSKQVTKWWEFVIAIVIGYAATFTPEIFMRIRINARKLSMESELILFETVILILIAHDNCTTELLLEYMSKFSVVFKDYLDLIIKKFQKIRYSEIDELLEEINYKEFTSIIKNIMRAEEIGVKEAFVNLSNNRTASMENRKRDYEKLIDSRIGKSKLISKIPVGLFILGYVIFPIMSIAFIQLIDIKNKMGNI